MPGADDNFMSRWSRRKSLQRQGLPAPEPTAAAPAAAPADSERASADGAAAAAPAGVTTQSVQPPAAAPPPTLHDVSLLTRDSDFSRFVKPGVSADVRNAALKKLFTDPRYNIMDGLDTYIDDYNKPDPLPLSMLRKMAQAGALGLLDDQSGQTAAEPTPRTARDENADLRLQPNDAAGCTGAEPGTGEDTGRVG